MSWFENVSPKNPMSDSAKPMFDTAAMAQLGAMSPLWMLFLSASTAGMAYWGMTRWMRLATPEKIVEKVVKLRLVPTEPAPMPVVVEAAPEPEVVVPEPVAAMAEPVVAEVASVSVVLPQPVAEAAAVAAPELVKTAPKAKAPRVLTPKVVKAKALKVVAPKVAVPVPVVAPVVAKIPAKRGRPPKVVAPKVEALNVETPKVAVPKLDAKTPAAPKAEKVKAPGAKRGPKPKPKI